MFESSDVVFLIYCRILESIRCLVRNALFSLSAVINPENTDYLQHSLFDIMKKMTGDCKVVSRIEIRKLVEHLIEITVQDSIVCPCSDQVSSTGSTSQYSGDFKGQTTRNLTPCLLGNHQIMLLGLVDIELYTERVIQEVVSTKVNAVLSKYLDTSAGLLDDNYEILKIAAISSSSSTCRG